MSNEAPLYFDLGSMGPDDVSKAISEFRARGFRNFNPDSENLSGAQEYSLYFLEFVQSVLPNLVGKVANPGVPTKHNPSVDPEKAAKDIWNGSAKFWAAVEAPLNYQLTMETLLLHLKNSEDPKRETFLSLGSGPGLYETFLGNMLAAIRGSKGSRIVCVDYAPEMTKMHRKLLQVARNGEGERITNVQPLTGDMTNLEFPNRSMDQIICNNSLQWVTDWRKAISEMARVINPNSLAYLYLFTNTNPMVMLSSDGTRLERGHLPVDELMDTLEGNKFQLINARQFTTIPGLGQRGGQASRYFIKAQYQADGEISSWRKANVRGSISLR